MLYFAIGDRIGDRSAILRVESDAFFSFDSGYYIRDFFMNAGMPAPQSIFRHPFLDSILSRITDFHSLLKIEHIALWELIVSIQSILASISVVLIYNTCLKINNRIIPSAVLALFFGFSSTMLIVSWAPESFVYASFAFAVLVYVFYSYIEGEKVAKLGFHITNGIMAFVITGITLTNSFVWFVASLMSYRDRKQKLIWTFSITGAVIIVFFITLNSSEMSLMEMVERSSSFMGGSGFHPEYVVSSGQAIFHHFLGSTFLFGNTATTPLHLSSGVDFAAFNLLPKHNLIGTISLIILYVLVVYSVIKNFRKHAFVRFLTISFAFNLLLHGVLKFGILESFIYGAHIVFIVPLLLAYLFRGQRSNMHFIWLVPFVVLMIVTNAQVIRDLYHFAVKNYPYM
jgi:hypothetical protein